MAALNNPFNDTFKNFAEANAAVFDYETRTCRRFIKMARSKEINLSRVDSLEGHTVRFEDLRGGMPVCYDGVPFIILGTEVRECHYGPKRGKKASLQNQEGDEHTYSFQKKRNFIQVSKKLGCPCQLKFRVIIRFPAFQIQGQSSWYARNQVVKQLKEGFGSTTEQEVMVFVKEVGMHVGHVNDVEAGYGQQLDKTVIEKIKSLVVNEGVLHAEEIKRLLDMEFRNIDCPPENRRFHPTMQDIRTHMAAARKEHRFSDEDQFNIEVLVNQWKKENPDDFYYFRRCTDNENFIFLHQTVFQTKLLRKYGQEIVVMDATYNTSKYNLPLFFLAVQTNYGYQVVASFLLQHENTASISDALKVLKDHNIKWSPKAFMCDLDQREIGAVEQTFEIMSTDEFLKKQLGPKLNRDKIKLWEAPYTKEDGSIGQVPQELLSKYATELGIAENEVGVLFESLRTHALQKLSEREKFKHSGQATLKLKISGNLAKKVPKQSLSVEIGLVERGEDLREKISRLVDHPGVQLKLICAGTVIKDSVMLQQQNMKNGSQILVLGLAISEADAQKDEKLKSELQDFRHAAELLSSRAEREYDEMDIQIADQTGKPIQLPPGEKKALTLAMALHEKGRQALKKKNITLALPLLLEADKEFRQCSAAILDSVDNYAILCLDIVWCYLCLKHIDELPDAEDRLKNSENFFHKSYGSSLERLMAVKGSTGEEQALFMKLHLLQGIVAFHQQRLEQATQLLQRAESELKRLQIDEEKLTTVMSMGFSEGETRLGLRACDGNIQNAVAHIMKRREEKVENAAKRKEERKKKRLGQHLGKTANGQNVNVNAYESLLGMGYPKGAAAEALRQSNNDLNLSLEVLQNHPEYLSLPDPEPKQKVDITDGMLAQVTGMGFDTEMAKRALVKHNGDVTKAIEELVSSGGNIEPVSNDDSPSTSEASSASSPSDDVEMRTAEQIKEEKDAVGRLVSDLPEDEEDYLDITLDEEQEFLTEYQSMIKSLRS